MVSEESMLKELQMIQDIIERQADNSFKIKGWTVTLVVVALIFRTNNFQLLAVTVPLIGFWGLDAYYLRQEKKYRMLYKWAIENRPDNEKRLFDMDASRFDEQVAGTVEMMTTVSLLAFYGIIGILVILYAYVVISLNGGMLIG